MTSFDRLLRSTPARLDAGRAGSRPRTGALLRFRTDHAAACDAVRSQWSDDFVAHLRTRGFLVVSSAAADRDSFVRNPGLGRQLAAGEADRLRAAVVAQETRRADAERPLVQLVLSDGLSAVAGERHADAIVPRLFELLGGFLRIAPPVAVRNGRVAIGDQIAGATGAQLVIHLIGERPGLSSAESLGCYLTYAPGPATTDADRKCISNIHAAGLDPIEAAATIAGVAQRIIAARTSGTACVL